MKAFRPFRPTIIQFILVMLPGSALTENLFTLSLFIDTEIIDQMAVILAPYWTKLKLCPTEHGTYQLGSFCIEY